MKLGSVRGWMLGVLGVLGMLGVSGLAIVPPVLGAPQTKDQQKCVNAVNKQLQKIAATQGKIFSDCVKNFARGKDDKLGPDGTLAGCFATDTKGKLSKATQKLADDFEKRCTGFSRIDPDSPLRPDFAITSPAAVSAAAIDAEVRRIADVFGSDLPGTLSREADDKARAKCQQIIQASADKCRDARLKQFNLCKKQRLLFGAESAAELIPCVSDDPKGKVAKACDRNDTRVDKIRKDIEKKCVAQGVNLSSAFPGCATDDPEVLHRCVSGSAECRICEALNAGDDLQAYPCGGCDLVPDAPLGSHVQVHDSEARCQGGVRDGELCGDVLAHVDCPPGPPAARCLAASNIKLNTVARTPLLTLPLAGLSAVVCENVAPDLGTGTANCHCEVRDLEPVAIPIIGQICLDPFEGCTEGKMDCDGGTPLDVRVVAEHEIAKCGLLDDPNLTDQFPGQGPSECGFLCQAFCASLPGEFQMLTPGCEGYCREGERMHLACDNDLECPGSDCVGDNSVSHRNSCNCSCWEVAGQPSRPGGFFCQAGVKLTVESDAPCRSTDGIDDVTTAPPGTCVPLTTEAASGIVVNADHLGEVLDQERRLGVPASCRAGHPTSGARLVGVTSLFDTPFGDQQLEVNVEID